MEKKKHTRLWIALIVIAALLIGGVIGYWEITHGNRQVMDLRNRFDYAIIRLPNGEVVEGKVSSWLDFNDSDVVQIKIGGKTYLTHYSNVCLISD